MQDTFCAAKLLIHTPQSITYPFYYNIHNALLDVWKESGTANHVEKSLHYSSGNKIYAV